MKKILGNRVLVEQKMTRKKSNILMTEEQKNNPDNFEIDRKIIMIGDEVYPEGRFEIGDIPVFGKYGEPEVVRILEKTDNVLLSNLIMHVDNIVGIDNLEIK